MMRRQGKPLSDCDGIGFGNLPYMPRSVRNSVNKDSLAAPSNHPDGDINPFTGQ